MSCCVQVFCPAFFVAIDHKYEAVVISIRGTLSIHVSMVVLMKHSSLLLCAPTLRMY